MFRLFFILIITGWAPFATAVERRSVLKMLALAWGGTRAPVVPAPAGVPEVSSAAALLDAKVASHRNSDILKFYHSLSPDDQFRAPSPHMNSFEYARAKHDPESTPGVKAALGEFDAFVAREIDGARRATHFESFYISWDPTRACTDHFKAPYLNHYDRRHLTILAIKSELTNLEQSIQREFGVHRIDVVMGLEFIAEPRRLLVDALAENASHLPDPAVISDAFLNSYLARFGKILPREAVHLARTHAVATRAVNPVDPNTHLDAARAIGDVFNIEFPNGTWFSHDPRENETLRFEFQDMPWVKRKPGKPYEFLPIEYPAEMIAAHYASALGRIEAALDRLDVFKGSRFGDWAIDQMRLYGEALATELRDFGSRHRAYVSLLQSRNKPSQSVNETTVVKAADSVELVNGAVNWEATVLTTFRTLGVASTIFDSIAAPREAEAIPEDVPCVKELTFAPVEPLAVTPGESSAHGMDAVSVVRSGRTHD